MEPFDIARAIHVAAGSVALVTFWTNAMLRKGSRSHRLVGRSYIAAMLVVIIATVPIIGRAVLDGKAVTGLFLAYLVVITVVALWLAWRAVRLKASVAAYVGGIYRPAAWATLLSGVAVVGTGLAVGAVLLVGMGAIGVVIGPAMLRFAGNPDTTPGWWVKRHYGGIIGAGVATHIAFLNLGLQRIVPVDFSVAAQYAAWFGPLMVAAVAGRWLDRRYRPRRPLVARVVDEAL